jgi:hypothetical protein
MMTACLPALFTDSPVTGYAFLFLPIAVQENGLGGVASGQRFQPARERPQSVDRRLISVWSVYIHLRWSIRRMTTSRGSSRIR